ncbi:MAG: DNA recombination protein RmuC [Candidatus Peregrinibacteria bacterium]|nr:DNA recombination protein RmuC [Candidatus Peregrinibacteria bacterium]
MDINTLLLITGLGAIAFVGYKILQKLEKPAEDQSLKMLQEHLFEIQKGIQAQDKSMNEQMSKSQQILSDSLQKQFASSQKIIREVTENVKSVTEKLTKLDETNKQVVGFAEQMKQLENILKNPKQRGILGEFFLENLLSNQLPPSHFKMQYAFKNGEIVDAAIFVRDKVIPVDAKFSLENYNAMMETNDEVRRESLEKEFKSDLKKRIDETSKYVRLDENTTDFAFMFIPADGVFYNLLSQKVGTLDVNTTDLIEYAFKKHVILVSPMTFYAYLQTVMQALKALTIEKQAVEIQKRVGDLGRHLNAYQDHMSKVGSHLSTTVNAYNNAGKEYGKIDKDVLKISGEGIRVEDIKLVEKPVSFEEQVTQK